MAQISLSCQATSRGLMNIQFRVASVPGGQRNRLLANRKAYRRPFSRVKVISRSQQKFPLNSCLGFVAKSRSMALPTELDWMSLGNRRGVKIHHPNRIPSIHSAFAWLNPRARVW